MKFLHLSDLHYNPNMDGRISRNIRNGLVEYLNRQNVCADELIITGDFRHALYKSNSEQEIAVNVKEYIMKIADVIGLPEPKEKHIHIVPGNHDRKRSKSLKNMERIKRIRKEYSSQDGNFPQRDINYLNRQFEFFDILCGLLYGSDNYWQQAWNQSRLHTYRVLDGVVLLCLNTSILHNSSSDRRNLIIGNDEVDILLNKITKSNPTFPIIVLGHHSPDYFETREKEAIEEIFRKYQQIQLYLCGDSHHVFWRKVNEYIEITMGCIKNESEANAAMLIGNTETSNYIAHHWASGAWEPFTWFNKEIEKALQNRNFTPGVISNPRILAEKLFQTIVGYGRFRGYNETNNRPITDIKDTIQSNSKEMTLEEIVFAFDPQKAAIAQTHSVSLYGKGGSGKTHQFINLIKEILFELNQNGYLKYPDILPYYLELNDIVKVDENKENVVLQTLAKSMHIEQDRLEQILEEAGSHAIIFADGMNEVTNSTLRRAIARAVCDIRGKYSTRIVLSSRDDHSELFNSLGRGSNQIFVKAEICELTEKQINDFFVRSNISLQYREISKATRQLLLTAQGLSMYTEMFLDDPDQTLSFSTLGSLLQSYCDRIMVIDRKESGVNLDYEDLLSFIAYHMVLLGKFQMELCVLEKLISSEQLQELRSNEKISLIFADHGKDDYEFSHQNFRDYYAGLYLAKQIKQINQNNIATMIQDFLISNNATSNDEILSLCADFLKSEQIQRVIDYLKSCDIKNYSFSLSVLIRIFAFANQNNISSLNLDSLDLREVCLSNYKLYSKQFNVQCISLHGAKIGEDTFLQNGLQTASSTICSYIYRNEQYICAFSASNAQIYNTSNNTWRCVRNLPNHGWVNCCCVIEMHNQPCILLGCSKSIISAFYPSDETVDTLFSIHGDNVGEIESIFCVKGIDQQSKIICSDTNGNVFMRNQYGLFESVPQLVHRFSDEKRETVKNAFDHADITPSSRLTISDNFIYLCYGNEILRCPLPLENKPVFELFKRFDESNLFIKDILYTDGLLILNMGKKISLISCNADYNDVSVIPFELSSEKKLHHFTKLSPTKEPRTVLVGVCAIQNDYSELQNFYRINVKYDPIMEEYLLAGEGILGLQTLTTYTGVWFDPPHSTSTRIATVSDDRSVQILSPDEEEIDTILHRGSYDGIHSIDIISNRELLIAQYDGSVSHWIRNRSGAWLCCDVFHIHNTWVWKVQHFYKDNHLHFISCSYDGTLKDFDTETGIEKILIDTGKMRIRSPILDFSIVFENGQDMRAIIALTEQKILWWHADEILVKTEHIMQLDEEWEDYIFRSVTLFQNKIPYVAVKVMKSEMEHCFVARICDSSIKAEIITEDTCRFIRCLKNYTFNGKELMIVGGNYNNMQYFAFYVHDGYSWHYKGSSNPSNIANFPTKIETVSDTGTNVLSFGPINDFIAEILPAEDEKQLRFSLSVCHKDGKLVNYEVRIDSNLTTIREEFHIDDISSQPMCITATDDQLLIGELNGKAMFIEKQSQNKSNIRTYANLTASVSVRLKNAIFDNDFLKTEFQKNFEGYFDFRN